MIIKNEIDDIIVKSNEIRNSGIKNLLGEIAQLPEEEIESLFKDGFECGISRFCMKKAKKELGIED